MTTTITMTNHQIKITEDDYSDDEYYEEQKYGYHYSDGTPILATLIPTPPIAFASSIDEDANEDPLDMEDASYLTNLSDGSRIPFSIVRASPNWDCAYATLKARNEHEKKEAEMAPFNEFNKLTDKMVEEEINRRFMATLPTMSRAMKARITKEAEEELARKNRASDQFYNKGRPGATSHTAWGHKTGGKNKKGLMEKSVEQINSERKARRLATKAKNDAEELIRAENFKRIAEIKERLALEEKASQPVIETEPETEIQIFKRLEIEACVAKIRNRVEVEPEELKVEEKVVSEFKWETVGSKHVEKMSKIASSIHQSLFCKPTTEVKSIATGKIGDKGTKMCKSVGGGFDCKYRDKCQFAHAIDELVLVPCKFARSCKRQDCTFTHPTETKESYCVRIGVVARPKPHPMPPVPQVVEKPVPKLAEKLIPSICPWGKLASPPLVSPLVVVEATKIELEESIKPEFKCEIIEVSKVVCKPTTEVKSEVKSIATGKIGDKGTKMCKSTMSGMTCKYGDKCQFAHNMSELVLVPCRFGQSCKRGDCTFTHPTETKESYCVRMGIKLPAPKPAPSPKLFSPAPAVSPWKSPQVSPIVSPIASPVLSPAPVPIALKKSVRFIDPIDPIGDEEKMMRRWLESRGGKRFLKNQEKKSETTSPTPSLSASVKDWKPTPNIFKIQKKDIQATMKYILDNKIEKAQIIFTD